MTRFVCLLRGVNVGKGNRVPMASFRTLLESLGCTGVRTLLNSGNAVFAHARRSPTEHAAAIHEALGAALGLDVPVVVKTAREFQAIVQGNTIVSPGADPSRLLVVFAQARASIDGLSVLAPLVGPGERFEIGGHAAYLLCEGGILQSKAASALLGKAGKACTTRNWATVLALGAVLAESSSRRGGLHAGNT